MGVSGKAAADDQNRCRTMRTDDPDSSPTEPQPLPARQSVMVITAVSDTGPGLTSAVLDSIEHDTDWIHVIAGGRLQFAGTPGDLAATSIDRESLAGEHPIELSLRVLLQARTD